MTQPFINPPYNGWISRDLPGRLGRRYWSGRLYRFLQKEGLYFSNQYRAQDFTDSVIDRLISMRRISMPNKLLLQKIHDTLIFRWNGNQAKNTFYSSYEYEQQFPDSYHDSPRSIEPASRLPHTPLLTQLTGIGGVRRDGKPKLGIRLSTIDRWQRCRWCGQDISVEFGDRHKMNEVCGTDFCRDIDLFLTQQPDVQLYRTIDPDTAAQTTRKGWQKIRGFGCSGLHVSEVVATFLAYSADVRARQNRLTITVC